MTTTTDYAALCAAIDAGDDGALLPLADWLEETGDPRAAGMRRASAFRAGHWLGLKDGPAHWCSLGSNPQRSGLDDEVFDRLAGGEVHVTEQRRYEQFRQRVYPSRSAAYLALEEALTP